MLGDQRLEIGDLAKPPQFLISNLQSHWVVSSRGWQALREKLTTALQGYHRRYPLRAGTVMLIERGDEHEIRNTGRTPLKTLNLYVPPAYDADGDERPAGRR